MERFPERQAIVAASWSVSQVVLLLLLIENNSA